jgi:hypothetical protein
MKKLIIALFCVTLFSMTSAQSRWNGFLKPVPNNMFQAGGTKAGGTSVWYFRPTVTLSALRFTYIHEPGKPLEISSFQNAGAGVSYAHFIPDSEGKPYNNFGLSGLMLFSTHEGEPDMSLVITANLLQYVNMGFGYDVGQKKLFFMTGISYSFN